VSSDTIPPNQLLERTADRRENHRQEVTDTLNPTINYVINNINQYTSVSRGAISNGNEHEVSSFQWLYDNYPVSYTYINDEHLKTVGDGITVVCVDKRLPQ
jgi:hypothetical protein